VENYFNRQSNTAVLDQLPMIFREAGLQEVVHDWPKKIRPQWQKLWHSMVLAAFQVIEQSMLKLGQKETAAQYHELLAKIDAASRMEGGAFVCYRPGVTLGRKLEN
jgi:hypothetical protein